MQWLVAPVALSVCLLASCNQSSERGERGGGGKLPKEALDESEVKEMATPLSPTSPRCATGICACRPVDDYGRGEALESDRESQPPPPGFKRYELRTGRGADTMKITIEGMGTFTKQEGPEPGCIYVDLPPGAHRVRYSVLAKDPAQGVEARLRISEYGEKSGRWYRSLAYRCGGGGPCTKDAARDQVEELAKVARGVHDPCGSTKVQGLRFSTSANADTGGAVTEFNLQLVLSVYKFAPRFPPDAPSCKGVSFHAAKDE